MRVVLQAKMPYISLRADPQVSSMSNNADRTQLLDKTTTQQPAPLHSRRSEERDSGLSHPMQPLPCTRGEALHHAHIH